MCSSKPKLVQPTQLNVIATTTLETTMVSVSDINGRPVLQPATSNRLLPTSSFKNSLSLPKSGSIPVLTPSMPNLKSPGLPAIKRSGNNQPQRPSLAEPTNKKSDINGSGGGRNITNPSSLVVTYSSAAIVDAPGSIAAARREQVAAVQVQRKMRIAHYGRSRSSPKYDSCSNLTSYFDPNSLIDTSTTAVTAKEEKKCSFITPRSDPIYVAYHDKEWGVPVHDDKLLFELLVLTGAQVGSDWTSVLKKRQQFREAFSGFEAEIVCKFTDKKITSLSSHYGIEDGLIRGAVENSNCILEIKKVFGSLDKYIWGFVNHKPIATQYKLNHKMPVKTSKSEAISKDMVRRGFRQAGPVVIHSFMQAAGLTNDHLITCPRHLQCVTLAASRLPNTTSTFP